MENQCIALAEAAGFDPVALRVEARAPWRWLPERLWRLWGDVPNRLSAENRRTLRGDWPDLVVACGRQSVPLAAHIHRKSDGRTFVVQCQDPRINAAHFDMVVPPEHDAMPPTDNTVAIVGSPNLALRWRLEAAAAAWTDTFAGLPRPLIAVAIGGSNNAYRLTHAAIDDLFHALASLKDVSGAGFAITTSRRTGPDNEALIRARAEHLGAWIWDGTGPSPILGLYALADAVVVTEDSVNMAAEVAASGKPLLIAELEGGSDKFDHFHDTLRARGIAKYLKPGPFEPWSYAPLTETLRAAEELRTRMAACGFELPKPRT